MSPIATEKHKQEKIHVMSDIPNMLQLRKMMCYSVTLVKNLTGSSRILADRQRPVKDPQG